MHSIRIHSAVALIISIYYRVGIWHRGDKPTSKEIRTKWFYFIYFSLYILSYVAGAIKSDKKDVTIFLTELSIGSTVFVMKFWILIWKQKEILNLLSRVCVFSIRNDEDHNSFNDKLRRFMKFVFVFVIAANVACSLLTVFVTVLRDEKTLFVEIGFPLDYKNSEIAFWIAFVFLFTGFCLTIFVFIFTTLIWYLLFICSLRYEVLASELKTMGRMRGERGDGMCKMTKTQINNYFSEDLKTSIDAHVHLRELTNEVESFFSDLFFAQLGTSGLCICGSIYCLAFDMGDSLLERLTYLLVFLYFISEIFVITHFGNEIMLSSNRLTYSLFESDWYDQPQSTKKRIIIFGEYLKQPQELVIGKLYPLTLETFTRILNSAYSMFNILKNFRQ